jgi:hypothetical protein
MLNRFANFSKSRNLFIIFAFSNQAKLTSNSSQVVHVKHPGCHMVAMPNLGAITAIALLPPPPPLASMGFLHLLHPAAAMVAPFEEEFELDLSLTPSTACPTSRAMSLRAQTKSCARGEGLPDVRNKGVLNLSFPYSIPKAKKSSAKFDRLYSALI